MGTQTAVLTVSDVSGNMSQCSSQLNIIDNSPINLLCRNLEAYVNSSGNLSVQASDFVDATSKTCSNTPVSFCFDSGNCSVNFSAGDVGQHRMLIIATDAYGNTDTCQADIIVNDTFNTASSGGSSSKPMVDDIIIDVYPNPTRGMLTIESFDLPIQGLEVRNMAGQTIWNKRINDQHQPQVNLSELPNAIYVLEIQVEGDIIRKLISVQH